MTDKEINYTPPISCFQPNSYDKQMYLLGASKEFERIGPAFQKRYGYDFKKAG